MQIQSDMTCHVEALKNKTINNWLVARHKVLIAYCELAGMTPNEQEEGALPNDFFIKHFCQILMDYISAGHFDIFEKIIAEYQYSAYNNALSLHDAYSKILISTDVALQFNDKYAEKTKEAHLAAFDKHLSILGKHLEQRFTLEDELINNVSVHS